MGRAERMDKEDVYRKKQDLVGAAGENFSVLSL